MTEIECYEKIITNYNRGLYPCENIGCQECYLWTTIGCCAIIFPRGISLRVFEAKRRLEKLVIPQEGNDE